MQLLKKLGAGKVSPQNPVCWPRRIHGTGVLRSTSAIFNMRLFNHILLTIAEELILSSSMEKKYITSTRPIRCSLMKMSNAVSTDGKSAFSAIFGGGFKRIE